MFVELPRKTEWTKMLRQKIKVNAPSIDKNVPNNFPMPLSRFSSAASCLDKTESMYVKAGNRFKMADGDVTEM